MKKYTIATLGCRTNQYESQLFSEQLRKMGYVQSENDPDLCIVNTCSVTDAADTTSRRQIRNLLQRHPQARMVVTGCGANESLRSIDPRIEILPNQNKERLIEFLFPDESLFPELSIERFDGHTRAFVKVQDGCNSFCTYCIIPYVRGRSRSRSIEAIVSEVKSLVGNGYKEVVLTGINIGDFESNEPLAKLQFGSKSALAAPDSIVCKVPMPSPDMSLCKQIEPALQSSDLDREASFARGSNGKRLADLVRAVDQIQGVERIRISSIDPDEVDEDLTDAIINGRHVCPNLHLVLQSGSNVILKRMNRKYTRQIFLDTALRLSKMNPDFTFTTDVIVGFPGESDSDFAETLDVITKVQFAKVHLFPYSVRARTRAALYPNAVAPAVIRQRKGELQQAADRAAFALRERYLNRTMDVLLEESDGHTANFLMVQVAARGSHHANELVEVEILENGPDGLKGRII